MYMQKFIKLFVSMGKMAFVIPECFYRVSKGPFILDSR